MLVKSYEKPLNKKNGSGTITKEYVNINGVQQGLIIESINQNKPLMLFLHGGPGFPIYPIIKAHETNLEQFFNVCYWDQRGAGMSYHKSETDKSLTVDQMVDDAIQIIMYLREKFSQDKIFLFGHSWGTYLGTLVANKKPELLHAYIGIGQIGSQRDSEQETYNFILNTAIAQNNKRAINQIKKVNFDENYYKNRSYDMVRRKYTDKYGGGFTRNGYSSIKTLSHIFTCPNYTFKERMNILRGNYYSYQSLAHDLAKSDLIKLIPTLSLPVFILQGLHDYQTTHTQAKRFYESVKSPFKKMFTFENSSHAPFIEEPERFYKIMQEVVLPIM